MTPHRRPTDDDCDRMRERARALARTLRGEANPAGVAINVVVGGDRLSGAWWSLLELAGRHEARGVPRDEAYALAFRTLVRAEWDARFGPAVRRVELLAAEWSDEDLAAAGIDAARYRADALALAAGASPDARATSAASAPPAPTNAAQRGARSPGRAAA